MLFRCWVVWLFLLTTLLSSHTLAGQFLATKKQVSLANHRDTVRRVEELFAFAKHILVLCPAGQRAAVQDGSRPSCADKVEAQVNAAQSRVNNLTQSILAKAFRGELTQDWRAANPELISGENSATALLKRIKAERARMGKKSK
ncbi:MAG: hypothetical protein ACRC1W_16925 [Shewanella sp.]